MTHLPNIKSAEKRVLVAEVRRKRNSAAKSQIHTQLRKFNSAVENGDKEKALQELVGSVKVLDKYAGKGIIHKNAAARKKSSLYAAYNAM